LTVLLGWKVQPKPRSRKLKSDYNGMLNRRIVGRFAMAKRQRHSSYAGFSIGLLAGLDEQLQDFSITL